MIRSAFIRTMSTLCAILLIGMGIWISGQELRSPHPKTRATPDPVRVSTPEPDRPVPAIEPDPLGTSFPVDTFDSWLAQCRDSISSFPAGTPEYDRLARSLRQLFATDPLLLRHSARVLVEDDLLDPRTQELIVGAIARADQAEADSTFRGLLSQQTAGESVKAIVLAGVGSMRQVSPDLVMELIRFAQVPGGAGAAALETLGILYADPEAVLPDSKPAMIRCVISRHREFVAGEDDLGLRATLNALARSGSTDGRTEIRSALKHPNVAVRCASIRAWSSLHLSDGSEMLLEVLESEKHPAARVEAVHGLHPASHRRPVRTLRLLEESVIERLLSICRGDPDEGVRHAALEFFGRRFDRAHLPPPPAVETIRYLMRSDKSPANREYAEWLLRERYGLGR